MHKSLQVAHKFSIIALIKDTGLIKGKVIIIYIFFLLLPHKCFILTNTTAIIILIIIIVVAVGVVVVSIFSPANIITLITFKNTKLVKRNVNIK